MGDYNSCGKPYELQVETIRAVANPSYFTCFTWITTSACSLEINHIVSLYFTARMAQEWYLIVRFLAKGRFANFYLKWQLRDFIAKKLSSVQKEYQNN